MQEAGRLVGWSKTVHFNNLEEKNGPKFHKRSILGIYSLTRDVNDTRKWCFATSQTYIQTDITTTYSKRRLFSAVKAKKNGKLSLKIT